MNWHLLIMLESALKASPSNHHLKLLLMRVYCSMGKHRITRIGMHNIKLAHGVLSFLINYYAYDP